MRGRDSIAIFVTAVVVFLTVFQVANAYGEPWESLSAPLAVVADLSTILLMTWHVRKQSRRNI